MTRTTFCTLSVPLPHGSRTKQAHTSTNQQDSPPGTVACLPQHVSCVQRWRHRFPVNFRSPLALSSEITPTGEPCQQGDFQTQSMSHTHSPTPAAWHPSPHRQTHCAVQPWHPVAASRIVRAQAAQVACSEASTHAAASMCLRLSGLTMSGIALSKRSQSRVPVMIGPPALPLPPCLTPCECDVCVPVGAAFQKPPPPVGVSVVSVCLSLLLLERPSDAPASAAPAGPRAVPHIQPALHRCPDHL